MPHRPKNSPRPKIRSRNGDNLHQPKRHVKNQTPPHRKGIQHPHSHNTGIKIHRTQILRTYRKSLQSRTTARIPT